MTCSCAICSAPAPFEIWGQRLCVTHTRDWYAAPSFKAHAMRVMELDLDEVTERYTAASARWVRWQKARVA